MHTCIIIVIVISVIVIAIVVPMPVPMPICRTCLYNKYPYIHANCIIAYRFVLPCMNL